MITVILWKIDTNYDTCLTCVQMTRQALSCRMKGVFLQGLSVLLSLHGILNYKGESVAPSSGFSCALLQAYCSQTAAIWN